MASTTTSTVTVLENSQVSPPTATVTDTSLPLTFFDIVWLIFNPMRRVLFYDFPCSKTNFTQTIVPNLKNSLSIALQHFFPLAGNLVTPSNISLTNPYIRYVTGDSVSVTFAECNDYDFNQLSGNHARDANELFQFVPKLRPRESCGNDVSQNDCVIAPVFAVQVTLFSDTGICIGVTNSHVVGDGSTMFNFIKAWSSFAKEQNYDSSPSFNLPFYDRSVIKDPNGLGPHYRKIVGGLFEQLKQQGISPDTIIKPGSLNKVRATFFMNRTDIQALKKAVIAKVPTLAHVSSITTACAYFWTCIAKARSAVGGEGQDADEPNHFGISIDCRARLEPPIPASYFGNCITPSVSHSSSRQIAGEGGFFVAAALIGEALHKKIHAEGGILDGAEKLFDDFEGMTKGEWGLGVAGSPNLDYYNLIDFGLCKPKKFEFVSEPFSLSRCKDSEGGDLEIGLCLPQKEMDVFPTIFAKEMRDLCNDA